LECIIRDDVSGSRNGTFELLKRKEVDNSLAISENEMKGGNNYEIIGDTLPQHLSMCKL
jgi:hypothetical protein